MVSNSVGMPILVPARRLEGDVLIPTHIERPMENICNAYQLGLMGSRILY